MLLICLSSRDGLNTDIHTILFTWIKTWYFFRLNFFYKQTQLLDYTLTVIQWQTFSLCFCCQPNREGVLELSMGGIFYCLGVVFFKSDGMVPFAHAIWHVFVVVGAAIHYYAIWRYLYATGSSHVRSSRWHTELLMNVTDPTWRWLSHDPGVLIVFRIYCQ